MGAIYLNGIKYGGGGGTEVVPNPEGEATSALEKLEVNGDIYSVGGGTTGDYMEKENPTGWGCLVSTSNTILDKDGNPTSANGDMILWGFHSTVQGTTASNGQSGNIIVGTGHTVNGTVDSLIAGDQCTVVGGAYHTISGRGNAQVDPSSLGDTILGYQSSATGSYNNVIGSFNHLLGAANYNTVIGDSSSANSGSQYCFTFGRGNAAASAENSSIIVGQNSTAQSGEYNEIFGKFNNLAGAKYNTIIGYQNSSYKNYNYSLGESNQTMLSHTVTIGSKNTIQGTAKDSYDSNANKGIIIGSKSTAILSPGANNTPDNMIIGNNIFLNSTANNNMVIGNNTTVNNSGYQNVIIGASWNNISGLGYGNIVLAPYTTIQGGDQKINYSTIMAGNNSNVNMSTGTHYGNFITGSRQKFNANGGNEGVTVLGAASTINANGYGGLFYGYNNNINCTGYNEGSIIGGWFTEADLSGYMSGSLISGYGTTVKAHTVRGSILWGSQSKLSGPDNDRCTFDRSAIFAGYTTVSADSILDSFVAGAYHNIASTGSLSGLTISGVRNTPKHDYQTLIGYELEGEEAHQTIIGKFNAPATNVAFAIGNGTTARSNAFTVDWDGNAELQGDLTVHYGGATYNVGACLSTASGGGGSSSHSYSTSEQVVGTWIDGSTVYERTVVSSPMPYTSDIQEIADITDWNLGVVVSFAPIIQQGFGYASDYVYLATGTTASAANTPALVYIKHKYVGDDIHQVIYASPMTSEFEGGIVIATIRYTKSTS